MIYRTSLIRERACIHRSGGSKSVRYNPWQGSITDLGTRDLARPSLIRERTSLIRERTSLIRERACIHRIGGSKCVRYNPWQGSTSDSVARVLTRQSRFYHIAQSWKRRAHDRG